MRKFRNPGLFFGALLALGIWSVLPTQAAQLIMFEQDYCEWCEQWNNDIGVVYAKTTEGKRAPLRRVNIHDPIPNDISSIRVERFTPTFVLVDDGVEIGRIRGYPGEDFFWGLLGQLIAKLPTQEQ